MSYQIESKTIPAQATLVVRDKVAIKDAGDTIKAAIDAVAGHLKTSGLQPTGAPFTRTLKFENGVFEFESGFPVAKPLTSTGKVLASSLPSGIVATTKHVGSQETSEQAYAALHTWIEKNGHQPAGAPWEVYVEDGVMQVFFPIR